MGDTVVPKLMIRDLYGKQIEELQVDNFILIDTVDRIRVLNYIAVKYQKDRLFRSVADGEKCKLFRVK